MANEQHLGILRQGVEIWNQWRKENPALTADLSRAHLFGAKLREADLERVDLGGAPLCYAEFNIFTADRV